MRSVPHPGQRGRTGGIDWAWKVGSRTRSIITPQRSCSRDGAAGVGEGPGKGALKPQSPALPHPGACRWQELTVLSCRTATVWKTLCPFWGEEYQVHLPPTFHSVAFYVMDEDALRWVDPPS